MNTLSAFLASIVTLFLSLVGGTHVIHPVQPSSVVVGSTTTESMSAGIAATSQKIFSVATNTQATDSPKITSTSSMDCISIKVTFAYGEDNEEQYSQCGNIGGYEYENGDNLFFIENKKLESGYNNGYQGLVTTLKNSAILGTKFSLLNNKCTLVHIDYKNNLSGDGTYCGILPHNYFVIGRKLYYGHYPSKVEERPAFLVGDLATSTEMKVLYSDDEGESYIIFNNKVLLNGKEIIGTNPRNFQVKPTSRAYRARANYSNDDTKVFYNGIVIPSADASSFDVSLSNGEVHLYYGRDKNNIYYKGEVVKGADPLSFKSFSVDSYESPRAVPYGVDSRYVYYATTTIHEADVTTFKALDWCAFEDKVHVFDLHGGLISNADPKTYKCPIMGL
jgi:hypothetical protein